MDTTRAQAVQGGARARATQRTCKCPPIESSTRNLAVFIDGTSNQFSKKNTNVVELYSRLIKNRKQLTFYNSGIGTYAAPHILSWRYQKQKFKNAVDLAIAWNFERILLEAYVWLSENYEDGDRIFLFGFSRGAYQVRALSAMIHMVGLIHKGNQAQVPFAFQLYAGTKPTDDIDDMRAHFKRTFSRNVVVHFVGAWDTVSSVGFVRDKTLPGTTDGMKHICFFRHALALHERRVKFLPEYACGDQGPSEAETMTQNEPQPHTKEVWFAGSHSDVGGGVVDNAQMNQFGPALRWMSFEALLAGVQLGPAAPQWKLENQIVHNSLTFGWWVLECLPLTHLSYEDPSGTTPSSVRRRHLCAPRQVKPGQLVHETAFNSTMGPPPAHGPKMRPHRLELLDKYLVRIPKKLVVKLGHRCAYAISPLVAGGHAWNGDAAVSAEAWCARISFGVAAAANMTEKDPYTAAKDIVERIRKHTTDDISESDYLAFKELTSTEPGRRSLDSPDVSKMLREVISDRIGRLKQTNLATPASFVKTARALALAFDENALDIASIKETGYAPDDLRPLAAALAVQHPRAATRLMRLFAKALICQTNEWISPDMPPSSPEWCAAYFKSGKRILAGRYDGQLVIYDTGNCVPEGAPWFGPRATVWCVAVSPADEEHLASGHDGGALCLWTLTENGWAGNKYNGHNDNVEAIAYSCDGKHVVSGSSDSTVIIWATDVGQLQRVLLGHVGAVYSVAWSPKDTMCVASGSADSTVRLWEADKGLLRHALRGHTHIVWSVAFSPDGDRLVSGSSDKAAIVWDISSGQQILALLGHSDNVWSLAFSPDGRHIVSGSDDSTIRVWNAATGEEEDRLPVLDNYMRTVAFSPDGKRIASACGNLQIWDAMRWEVKGTDKEPSSTQASVAVVTDGNA